MSTDDRRTPSWNALEQAHRVLYPSDLPPPFTHLSDQQLLAALDLLKAGVDVPLDPYPGVTLETGFEHLSDRELRARMQAMVAQAPSGEGHP